MPNTRSAIRRTKRASVQTSVNRIRKSKYKSAIKQMSNYITSGKMKEAKDFLPKLNVIDRYEVKRYIFTTLCQILNLH